MEFNIATWNDQSMLQAGKMEVQEPEFTIHRGLGGSVSSYIKLFSCQIIDSSFQVKQVYLLTVKCCLCVLCTRMC